MQRPYPSFQSVFIGIATILGIVAASLYFFISLEERGNESPTRSFIETL